MSDNGLIQEKADIPVVSYKEWLLTFLILLIPFANIVMPFVWAFGGNANPSKANYFKAQLTFVCIMFVLAIVFWGMIFAFFSQMMYKGY
jgi:hypothetical protein